MFNSWLIKKLKPSNSKTLWRIDGELLDDMKRIPSTTFNSLRKNHHKEIATQLKNENRVALFTLSIAVRDSLAY